MKILTDTHCHTLVSDHAFSTVHELAMHAKKIGLEAIAITDHGPALPDGANGWHFGCMDFIPQTIDGVIMIRGAEANILNYDGELDIDDNALANLQLVIASMHDCVLKPSTKEEHTKLWLKIAENPLIDVIGHSGNNNFIYDFEKVIPEFNKNNKAVEINNHSFSSRPGSLKNCTEIAKICKKYGVKIILGSDAHICYDLCKFDDALKMLMDINFPEELVINRTAQTLINWLSDKKKISFK